MGASVCDGGEWMVMMFERKREDSGVSVVGGWVIIVWL